MSKTADKTAHTFRTPGMAEPHGTSWRGSPQSLVERLLPWIQVERPARARKIIMSVGIIVVAAIAIAWSTLDRRSDNQPVAQAAPTVNPHDIMRTIGRDLPAEYWADPF
jgi:hypothetical protein